MDSVLFYVSLGDRRDGLESWIGQAGRYGDVAIVQYGRADLPEDIRRRAKVCLRSPGFKFPNFLKLLDEGLIRPHEYRGVFFIDDDIVFPADGLERFFSAVERHGLDWAHPSLDGRSVTDWPHQVHKPGLDIERSDFLEIQTFYLSRRMLDASLRHFRFVRTGRGLDYALMFEAVRNGFNRAVVHSMKVLHSARSGSLSVRELDPCFEEEGRKIEKHFRRCFRSHVSIRAIYLMSLACKRVRFRYLIVFQVLLDAAWPVRVLRRHLIRLRQSVR